MNTSKTSTVVYRASAQPYIVFSCMYLLVLAFQVYGPTRWYDFLPFSAALVLAFVWLRGFAIRISPEKLEFQTLFGGKRSVDIGKIRSIELSFAHARWWLSRNSGALQLVVKHRDAEVEGMHINAKVFASDAIRAVLDLDQRGVEVHGQEFKDGIAMKYVRDARRRFKSKDR